VEDHEGHQLRLQGAVICLEGPSAVGKTTLAEALAREFGAAVVPELDSSGAPPPGRSAAWFVERHAAQWRRAREMAAGAPFSVLDGDPFKGLWYNRVYADEGWEGVDTVAPLYRAQVEAGALAFPDLYVVLTASDEELRRRRAFDVSRSRRNFEKHLRMAGPLLDYFREMRDAAPGRVTIVGTGRREELTGRVLEALGRLPPGRPDSLRLLNHMTGWLGSHSPAA
jgi:DNA polymerase III delta prime subunit